MRLQNLPTLATRPTPKLSKGTSRLDTAEDARKQDERLLKQWKRLVRLRDGKICRCCKRKVVVTLTGSGSVSRRHWPAALDCGTNRDADRRKAVAP